MTKIFMVLESFEGLFIGAFSSEEKAQEFIDKHENKDNFYIEDIYLDDFPVRNLSDIEWWEKNNFPPNSRKNK